METRNSAFAAPLNGRVIRVAGNAGGSSTSFDVIADRLVDFARTLTFATNPDYSQTLMRPPFHGPCDTSKKQCVLGKMTITPSHETVGVDFQIVYE